MLSRFLGIGMTRIIFRLAMAALAASSLYAGPVTFMDRANPASALFMIAGAGILVLLRSDRKA